MAHFTEALFEDQSTQTAEYNLSYKTKHLEGYYLLLACATLLVYDYFLTIGEEWAFVWRQGPCISAAKLLFGLNRYYPIVTCLVRVYVFSIEVPTEKICSVGLGFTSWSTVINFATVEVILFTRIWALYSRNKCIGVFLSTPFVFSLSTALVLRYIKPDTINLHLVAPMPQSLTICKRSPPAELFFQYVIGLVCETVIFILLIRKVWATSMGASATPIVNALLTSGILYYAIVFIAFLLTIIATAVPAIYTPIADANPAVSIASVACSRFMLSLRGVFYRPGPDTTYRGTTININLRDLSDGAQRQRHDHREEALTPVFYEESGGTTDTRGEG